MHAQELEQKLTERVVNARHGEKLPPVREMMREYQVGQAMIQEVLGRMAHQGKLLLRVGRGTFVQKPAEMKRADLAGASVLLLSLRDQTERSHDVARRMHTQLSRQGARCVQLVYERIDEALDMLHVKPRFDVCVLQSYFDIVPLGLLAYLRERCSGLVVDGARIAGVDVDAVASDWRGAMDLALEQLHAAGHERIGFVTWPGDTQPLEGLRHHFVSLRQCLQRTASTMPLVTLGHMPRPGESSAALVSATLDSLGLGRRQAPTALVVWAGAQADALETALQRLPAKARQSARIILLGHVNRPEDHLSQFDIVGSNSDDAADSLVQCIRRRIEEPQQPHKTIYLTNHYVQFATGARPRVKTMLRGNARQIRSSTTIACNSRR